MFPFHHPKNAKNGFPFFNCEFHNSSVEYRELPIKVFTKNVLGKLSHIYSTSKYKNDRNKITNTFNMRSWPSFAILAKLLQVNVVNSDIGGICSYVDDMLPFQQKSRKLAFLGKLHSMTNVHRTTALSPPHI